MIRREQRRLQKIFQRLLLLSLASPAAVEACGSSSNSGAGGPGGDAGTDSTLQPDVAMDSSGGGNDTGGPADAAPDAQCAPGQPYFTDASYAQYPDSGPDSPYYPCYYYVDFPCGTTYATGPGSAQCFFYLTECSQICTLEGGFIDCLYPQGAGCLDGSLTAQPGQPATVACGLCNGVGRRPAGLRRRAPKPTRNALGEYFAQAAHLEAASVHAFHRLRDELCAHGAPLELVRTAARSARDEVRHARVTALLARRYGGEPSAAKVSRRGTRGLEAIARENAVEGCVRETFGAMVATWQAAHARDGEVRRTMARIAVDETRHAALAWAVARWADERLDAGARRRIAKARRAAVQALARDISNPLPSDAAREAGLPSSREAGALVDALRGIWA